MKQYLQTHGLLTGYATNRELVTGLRSALDHSYARILKAAGDEWQRRFAGKDPSDACVTVRISSFSRNDRRRFADVGCRPQLQQFASGAA